jgi:hypothetical protein
VREEFNLIYKFMTNRPVEAYNSITKDSTLLAKQVTGHVERLVKGTTAIDATLRSLKSLTLA